MKLYSMAETSALAAHIAVEWSGRDYDLVILKPGEQHKAAYLAINPMGSVPALVLADGTVLTELPAVLVSIDACARARFFPDHADPFSRARLAQLLSFLATEVQGAFLPLFEPQRFHPDRGEHATLRSSASARLQRLFDLLDSRFAGPYFFGAQRSVADPYIYVLTRWIAGTALPLAAYRRLQAFSAAMSEDAAVRGVLARYAH